jgi:uncharacterized membrane protein
MDIFVMIQQLGKLLDLVGVVIIVFGVILSTIAFSLDWIKEESLDKVYKSYRQNLARVILLGLEILVAGDIIRSVAGVPTFTSIGILGLIVIIRTVLSITFDMEVEGRWPWDGRKKSSD